MSFGELESLAEPLRSRVKAALAAQQAAPAAGGAATAASPALAGAVRKRRGLAKPKEQTATERAYNRERLRGCGQFEAVSFKLLGGSRYTADFYVPWGLSVSEMPEVHEVKGSHRFASQSRATMAFREAAAAHPEFRFVWAERQPKAAGGGWLVMFDSMKAEKQETER